MNAPGRRLHAAPVISEGDDKAFWISFADLMTALMVMFLMVMAVALMAITKATGKSATEVSTVAQRLGAPTEAASSPQPGAKVALGSPQNGSTEALLEQAMQDLDAKLSLAAADTPGVHYDPRRHVIHFGERGRFATGSHQLDRRSAELLRQFVPQLLAITESEQGKQWIQRVVVEGFADTRGDYLFNLNLSLQRAQRVMCALLDTSDAGTAISAEMRGQARDIFSVGGFSFNDQRDSMEASRRIELRVEFGARPVKNAANPDTGVCRLPA
jgi:outer membrane protein OmpA-like peptidoglycan-associated protein